MGCQHLERVLRKVIFWDILIEKTAINTKGGKEHVSITEQGNSIP